ncbi:hypothetical protein T459_29663 [Capsicum annuum]|uniref:Uncharacterized protein n=1 Tax=Capsicum annuum TaxID=4072 RepID=A0A2G2Y685_CAPAN|nr:hypothetical protein T459_29663 [Capsicum annuum]
MVQQSPIVLSHHREKLVLPVEEEKLKQVVWFIGGDKVPGPDDFGSQFNKDCWDIIKHDFLVGAQEFFSSGKLLKDWNTTTKTLIPKGDHATSVSDYRPIVILLLRSYRKYYVTD